jgi:bacterioferritin (cytochrome b1)
MITEASSDSEGEPSSRRSLLLAAGAGLAGVVLAGCGSESVKQQVDNSKPLLSSDVDILNHLLHLEHVGIAAYTAGIPLLAQPTAKAGQLFLNDEINHAGDVAGLVREVGGKPIKPAPSYALGHPRTSEEVLMLLHAVEQEQIAAYLDAIRLLEPGVVKQQVASILANDAQHLAVVHAALGQPAVPSAFVTGRE